jgi:ATP-dependent DNA helicase RecG
MNILPLSIETLIHSQAIESVRREFKKSWSEPTLEQVIHTICAYANDFFNLNGGYIIIGIGEESGKPILPPAGLDAENIERIQQEIRGHCNQIDPVYQPILSPEIFMEKNILVVWAPAGDSRPYQAPIKFKKDERERAFYVRQGPETVDASANSRKEILRQLIQMTAKTPFDDRRNLTATLEMISPTLVRHFLSNINSALVSPTVNISDIEIYRRLRLTTPVNSHEVPRNVALLFFVNDPEQFFSGARIEIVQFGDGAGGDLIEEKMFKGPLDIQISQALDYLNSLSTTLLKKIPEQAKVNRMVAFPYEAMEEALVNAVYHRSYEDEPEPVKVYLYPDRMEIISYPGPVPGIELRHLQPGALVPPVPNRNRRIGEFLKDLRLAEGRGTGIPKIRRKMNENGSPEPVFEFDEGRTYFRVILPAHPQYIIIQALRESTHLWATGNRQRTIQNLESAIQRAPHSGALAAQLIEYHASLGELSKARELFRRIEGDVEAEDRHLAYIALAKVLLDQQHLDEAREVLRNAPTPVGSDEIIELALLYKRSKRYQQAHRLFADNFEMIKNNPKAVHEYAQTKMSIAKNSQGETRARLNREAGELLRRAIQLSDDPARSAWCWSHLAQVLSRTGAPAEEIERAYQKAVQLLPDEPRFRQYYQEWKKRGLHQTGDKGIDP